MGDGYIYRRGADKSKGLTNPATASKIFSGKTALVNGVILTGNALASAVTVDQYKVSSGYKCYAQDGSLVTGVAGAPIVSTVNGTLMIQYTGAQPYYFTYTWTPPGQFSVACTKAIMACPNVAGGSYMLIPSIILPNTGELQYFSVYNCYQMVQNSGFANGAFPCSASLGTDGKTLTFNFGYNSYAGAVVGDTETFDIYFYGYQG